MSVCWRIGSNSEYLAKGPNPCAADYVQYDGPITYAPDGETVQMVWDGAIGLPRPYTDADRLQAAITARINALKIEVETYIDQGIYPITRSMLRDGVLSDAVADDVREFIALCYAEANETIDAIEAVATIGEVDDPAAVWPIYGGAI